MFRIHDVFCDVELSWKITTDVFAYPKYLIEMDGHLTTNIKGSLKAIVSLSQKIWWIFTKKGCRERYR